MVKKIASNLKYPMLTFLVVGAIIGLIASWNISRNADKVIEEYKQINKLVIEEYREKIEKQKTSIETLAQENSSLKKHVKVVEITKPDGSKEYYYEMSEESEKEIIERVRIEIEREYMERERKLKEEISIKEQKITSINNKITLHAGITNKLDSYIMGDYFILDPFGINFGYIDNKTYLLGISFKF